MSLILSGTDGLSDVDGSAATPAIRGTDANTGIFFPAADTIAFSEGGVEAMRIDSAGNVGIGTNSPSSYGKLVSLGADNATTFAAVGATNMLRVQGYNSTYVGTVLESVNLAQSANTPMFINASQTQFGISGTERMRIDSSGNLLVGQTATGTATGSTGMWAGSLTINPNLNTSSGSANVVWSTPSGLFYRSTSSIRYKENVENAVHGLQEVLQLRPVTYNGKSDIDGDKRFGGFIAEEVDAIGLTEFVVYDEENRPDSLGYDRMVSLLTKAIQEQQALILSLTARITALESK